MAFSGIPLLWLNLEVCLEAVFSVWIFRIFKGGK